MSTEGMQTIIDHINTLLSEGEGMYPGDSNVRMVVIPAAMQMKDAEKAIMVCRELGLLDLNESLWLVPRQLISDANLIGPSRRMANGRLA